MRKSVTRIDEGIKCLIERCLKICGSQGSLARYLGYSGRNCGCQINYFLCGKRKTIPVEKVERLREMAFNESGARAELHIIDI